MLLKTFNNALSKIDNKNQHEANWFFFCIDVAFYVIKIYYCPKIVDMHVWF